MHSFRIASSLFASALLVVACGDDKGDTQATNTTTDSTPLTGTDPGPTSTGTTGPEPTSTSTDPDTTNGSNSNSMSTPSEPTSEPTTSTDPTTAGPTTDPTETTSGGNDGMFCADTCRADMDCTLNGMDLGYTCVDGTCTPPGCEFDGQCHATYSGWLPCASQAACVLPGQVCVDVGGGNGYCATPPSDVLPCEAIGQAEVMYPALEGGEQTTVCANTSASCDTDTKMCVVKCAADTDCMQPAYPVCDVDSGACECGTDEDCLSGGVPGQTTCTDGKCGCGSDDDCVGNLAGSKCTDSGLCGCASDQECAGNPNSDTCYDGFCGCSSDAVCTTPVFDGTMTSCK